MEASFYLLNEEFFVKSIVRLVEKIVTNGQRVTIFSDDDDMLANLDKTLWTFSTNAFIPHGGKDLGSPEMQLAWLTNSVENLNDSSVLIMVNNFEYEPWTELNFAKILFTFGNNLANQSLTTLDKLKTSNIPTTYWQQTDKGWEKKN